MPDIYQSEEIYEITVYAIALYNGGYILLDEDGPLPQPTDDSLYTQLYGLIWLLIDIPVQINRSLGLNEQLSHKFDIRYTLNDEGIVNPVWDITDYSFVFTGYEFSTIYTLEQHIHQEGIHIQCVYDHHINRWTFIIAYQHDIIIAIYTDLLLEHLQIQDRVISIHQGQAVYNQYNLQ